MSIAKNSKIQDNSSQYILHSDDIRELAITSQRPPEQKSLEDIYRDIKTGLYAIPDFQRDWIWDVSKIAEMWESIFQGYYIGPILTWKSDDDLKKIPIAGAPPLQENTKPILILDGQQRMTAIYYALAAPDHVNPHQKQEPYRFFVNVKALLDKSCDSNDIVQGIPEKHVRHMGLDRLEKQYQCRLFPLTQLGKSTEWVYEAAEYLKKQLQYDDEVVNDYRRQLHTRFNDIWKSYKILDVTLPDMSLDNVATIFERINNTNTTLNVFDLLNARFRLYGISLKELDKQMQQQKYVTLLKRIDLNKYILQALSLYKSGSQKKNNLLKLDKQYSITSSHVFKNEFSSDWNLASKSLNDAIRMIMSNDRDGFGAISSRLIPHTTMIPVITALFMLIDRRNDQMLCKQKIRAWYWNSIVSKRYKGSTDTVAAEDFKELKKSFDTKNCPFKTNTAENLEAARAPTNAIFKAVLCLIAKNGARDFFSGMLVADMPENITIKHHPLFSTRGHISNKSVLNMSLLPISTINKIRNHKPSEFLKLIKNETNYEENEIRAILKTHLISDTAFACLLNDDFNEFVKIRKHTIIDEFQKMIMPENKIVKNSVQYIRDLLYKQESSILEYKTNILGETKAESKNLKEVIVKTLCAFMNTNGGDLLIGVNNDGKPVGLKSDYLKMRKQNADEFRLRLSQIINEQLDVKYDMYIMREIISLDGVDVCWCKVDKSPRPVYCKFDKTVLYRRNDNQSQPLRGEEITDYISERWPNSF